MFRQQKLCPILCSLTLVACTHVGARAADFEHSWVEPKFTSCEGVGVHGTFRVYAGGSSKPEANGAKIVTALRVHTLSAVFIFNEGSTGAAALVKVDGAVKEKMILGRPTTASVEAAPKPDETRRVYLPRGKTLAIPKGGELWVVA